MTDDLSLIRPHADELLVEIYFCRFENKDIVVFKTIISFALKSFMDSCPIELLDNPICLSFFFKK